MLTLCCRTFIRGLDYILNNRHVPKEGVESTDCSWARKYLSPSVRMRGEAFNDREHTSVLQRISYIHIMDNNRCLTL